MVHRDRGQRPGQGHGRQQRVAGAARQYSQQERVIQQRDAQRDGKHVEEGVIPRQHD